MKFNLTIYGLSLILAFTPLSIKAASFDCKKAKQPLEKLICNNPELDAIDEKMGTVYKRVKKESSNPEFIKNTQSEFALNQYQSCVGDVELCIDMVKKRIETLNLYSKNITEANGLLSATSELNKQCNNKNLNAIIKKLNLKKDELSNELLVCKKLPDNPTLTVFAISTNKELVDDLYLIIAKTETGEIVSHLTIPSFYKMGAHSALSELKIDTANYSIAPNQRAFGLITSISDFYHGGTSVMNLYLQKGLDVIPVASGIIIESNLFKQIEECEDFVSDSESKSNLMIQKTATNGFFDILVNVKEKNFKVNKCKEKELPIVNKKYLLKYDEDKKQYEVPEDIGFTFN